MMSLFGLKGQHQFLFPCYMLPTRRFRSVHVVTVESVVRGMSSVMFT